MNRRSHKALNRAIEASNPPCLYSLSVKALNGLKTSITTSEGYTRQQAKDQAIRKADELYGVDGYEIESFKKL